MGDFTTRAPESFKTEREVDLYYNALLRYVGAAFNTQLYPLPEIVMGRDKPFKSDADRLHYCNNVLDIPKWNRQVAAAKKMQAAKLKDKKEQI